MYSGFRPLGDGTTHDLVDLTHGNAMFWPPENQEWFISSTESDTSQIEVDDILTAQASATIVEDHFDRDNMLPYLSPTSLFSKEEEAVKTRAASSWGGYVDTIDRQESFKQWQGGNDHLNQEPTITPMATNQVTSADATVVQQTNANTSLGRFVIPKVSKRCLNSNKANELAAKVSPPARTILPKPVGTVQNPQSVGTSGVKPQKKKK